MPYDLWAAQGFIEARPGNVVDYGAIEERVRADAALFDAKEPVLGSFILKAPIATRSTASITKCARSSSGIQSRNPAAAEMPAPARSPQSCSWRDSNRNSAQSPTDC